MYIPSNYFMIINILVAIIILIYIFKSYKNGFLYELVNLGFLLVSIFVSWLIAPILASKAGIFDVSELITIQASPNQLQGTIDNVNLLVNSIVWFAVILLLLNVLFLLVKPLLKFLSKIPVLGTVNKVLGGVIGVFYGLFVSLLISLIFTFPVFKNGQEVVDGTILKYARELNSITTKYIVEHLDLGKIQKETENFDIDVARKDLETWLVQQGIIND